MTQEELTNVITNNIQALCDASNLRLTKLEKEIGAGAGILSRWKMGAIKTAPSLAILLRIAQYFGVPLQDIISENLEVNPKELEEKRYLIDNICTNIDVLLKLRDLTPEMLESQVKVERGYITNLLELKDHIPPYQVLFRIAMYFDLRTDDLTIPDIEPIVIQREMVRLKDRLYRLENRLPLLESEDL